jgi:L-fuconolactonase
LLGEFGFTYDLLIYHYQLEEALKFVSQLPNMKIVIDHIAKPSIKTKEINKWRLNIAALSTFENVYCKVSGMTTEAQWKNWTVNDFYPYLDTVFESFGPSRLMYGSDWPVCLVAARYEDQLNILTTYMESISANERNKVMGETAVDFYQL